MKFSRTAVLDAPIDRIDLEEWLYALTDAEYQAASPRHRAAGITRRDGVRGMVAVDAMGGHLVVQHYQEVRAAGDHVEMHSPRSRAYLFHLVPVSVEVRWTLRATARDTSSSTLTCTVEVILPPVVRVLAPTVAMGHVVHRHVDRETAGFAADINRKLAARRTDSAR